nr:hypothetical protein [Tanacetum cinerariifolium]
MVRRLEKKRQFKSLGLKRLRKVGTAQRVESSADTVMDDLEMHPNRGKIVELDADEDVTLVDDEEDMNADVQGRLAESQAKVYHLDLQHARKLFSMQDTNEAEPAEVEEVIKVVTAAKLMTDVVTAAATSITVAQVPKASAPRRRRGVVIQDPKETTIASVIMHTEARKNMIIYLKNMAGFKLHFFKGMTYNEIRPIFENHYNLNQAFLERVEEEVTCQKEEGSKRKGNSLNQDAAKKQRINEEKEELKAHLQIVVNDDDDVFTEATPLASKVHVVDYQIHHENNKPYYKIIRADGTRKLFLSFITLLKNFDREDLEMFWKLVQERFQSLEPKNFLDDFLLNTLKIMFEKPNVEANSSHHNTHNYSDDSASGKEIPFDTLQSGTNVEQSLKLMLFKTSRKYAKGLLLLVEDLMLLVQVKAVR